MDYPYYLFNNVKVMDIYSSCQARLFMDYGAICCQRICCCTLADQFMDPNKIGRFVDISFIAIYKHLNSASNLIQFKLLCSVTHHTSIHLSCCLSSIPFSCTRHNRFWCCFGAATILIQETPRDSQALYSGITDTVFVSQINITL